MKKNRYSTREAGIYLKCHPNHLSNLRSLGKGPRYVKQGHQVFYLKADLDNYIKDQTTFVSPGK